MYTQVVRAADKSSGRQASCTLLVYRLAPLLAARSAEYVATDDIQPREGADCRHHRQQSPSGGPSGAAAVSRGGGGSAGGGGRLHGPKYHELQPARKDAINPLPPRPRPARLRPRLLSTVCGAGGGGGGRGRSTFNEQTGVPPRSMTS